MPSEPGARAAQDRAKRQRCSLVLLAATGIMVVVAAVGAQKKPGLLLLDWAGKAPAETPPVALLIELGLKNARPSPWSGRATVAGAKVVRREGYPFRDGDQLLDPDAWEASSRRPLFRFGPIRCRITFRSRRVTALHCLQD